ncbi:hypothetical protein BCR39DRAFT_534269 [Naematelia encephala]|uniref:Uncharacterized protein n=1 Tax=Naematelia encephala TaxID=71784 RepID=A0A1Y2B1A1_9TREE|nr:hypothetical protein BCR39DRAFT_534269 [Naematelia encephala]
MADASLFLRKRKDKQRRGVSSVRVLSAAPSPPVASTSSPRPGSVQPPQTVKSEVEPVSGEGITEIKLYSISPDERSRYSLFKLHSDRACDPTELAPPVLFNRKHPGPRAPPTLAYNAEGKVVGRYLFDGEGKPILDENGKHRMEKREEMDMSLVGTADGAGPRKRRKGVREVYNTDVEAIRLKREEATPWVLETGTPKDSGTGTGPSASASGAMPEHWVGRMVDQSHMPSVLFVNDGTGEAGFKVIPVARHYRFNPERPFQVLDSDQANKLFETQQKQKITDRWSHRPGGSIPPEKIKREVLDQELRARRIEERIAASKSTGTGGSSAAAVKKEPKWDDDYKREGRRLERGLEGGADEELDYDETEMFQDDEENNTFYHNAEEEEDQKLQDEQLKKEFRLANANVGDRPQIDDEASDEDLEEMLDDGKLNSEGKRLRRMMKKRGGDDLFGDSDSDDESEEEEETATKDEKKEADGDKDKDKDNSVPGSAERPSRPPSRGPNGRGTSSPTGNRRAQPPSSGKASTAPPGSGAALLAQRAASRGASPRRSRGTTPTSGRATSPENRASSPSGTAGRRSASPAVSSASTSKRPGGPSTRSPEPNSNSNSSASTPGAGAGGTKRKPSPLPTQANEISRKKKKSSSSSTPTPTPGPPDDLPTFPGAITADEVRAWFASQTTDEVPFGAVVSAFKGRLGAVASEHKEQNQKAFTQLIPMFAKREKGVFKIKPGVRPGA